MQDWELFEAWRNGDEPAGEALVGRYLDILTRFFRNKVNDPHDAAELISETFMACTQNKGNVRDPEAFRSFLFAAALNILRGHYRKKVKRRRELDDFADICVGDAEHPRSLGSLAALQEETRLLVRALRRISMDQQIVLELEYFEGMSATTIADLLGVSRKTVYTRVSRGKERLRAVMLELSRSPELVESTMIGIQTWAMKIREGLER